MSETDLKKAFYEQVQRRGPTAFQVDITIDYNAVDGKFLD
jgi:hypothetical protein